MKYILLITLTLQALIVPVAAMDSSSVTTLDSSTDDLQEWSPSPRPTHGLRHRGKRSDTSPGSSPLDTVSTPITSMLPNEFHSPERFSETVADNPRRYDRILHKLVVLEKTSGSSSGPLGRDARLAHEAALDLQTFVEKRAKPRTSFDKEDLRRNALGLSKWLDNLQRTTDFKKN